MSVDLTTGPGAARPPVRPVRPVQPVQPMPEPSGPWSRPQRVAALPAVRRDLDRLVRVLAEPITPVRRTALVQHVGYLADQLWSARPDLAVRHASTLSRWRRDARRWAREPALRPVLRVGSEHMATVLTETGTETPDTPDVPEPIRLGLLLGRRPTVLAYRHFWLLDDLPAHLAEPLTVAVTAPTRWVLRNLFSGGYNRRACLMWIGGGSGPAV